MQRGAAWGFAIVLASCAAERASSSQSAVRTGDVAHTDPRAVEAAVRTLATETASIRGLAFAHDVPVAIESPVQIIRHVHDELAGERDEIEMERQIGIAMGVLPRDIDLTDALAQFIGTEAQGYYDPSSARLVVSERDAALIAAPGPAGLDARATVVHELVHALQHQHFSARVDDDAARTPSLSDTARARLALLEGDATLVAMEWTQRRRGGRLLGADDMERRVARWAENAQVLTEANVPPYLVESAEMPYEAGLVAVASWYRIGGFARIDTLIADPNVTAARVLHPERESTDHPESSAIEPIRDEALAQQGYRIVADRTLGEIELRLQLGRVMRNEPAARLASAWRADRFVLFERDGTLAMRWVIACADSAAARSIANGFAPLLARWNRDGCPGLAGGRPDHCPATITVTDARVTLSRGA
jgi:hypothetical protein